MYTDEAPIRASSESLHNTPIPIQDGPAFHAASTFSFQYPTDGGYQFEDWTLIFEIWFELIEGL